MVGLQPLELAMMVRIHLPQPKNNRLFKRLFFKIRDNYT